MIITAASRGIGAGCAKALARKGYRLVLMARSPEVLSLADELEGTAVQGSVSNADDLKKVVDTALRAFGRVDAVVNNTGHAAKGPLLDLTDQEWFDGFELLYLNVVRMTRIVTPLMLQQGCGAFVNISSFAAREPAAEFPVSAPIRRALSAYCKIYSELHAEKNIRMNNILPGWIDSDGSGKISEDIPMRRFGLPEEIGKVAAFLVSKEAAYLTGQDIAVDGGLLSSI